MEEQEGTCDKSRGPKGKKRDRLVHQSWTARIRGVRSTQLEPSSLPDARDSFLLPLPQLSLVFLTENLKLRRLCTLTQFFLQHFFQNIIKHSKTSKELYTECLRSHHLDSAAPALWHIYPSRSPSIHPFSSLMCFEVNCQETLAHSGSRTVDRSAYKREDFVVTFTAPGITKFPPKTLYQSCGASSNDAFYFWALNFRCLQRPGRQ